MEERIQRSESTLLGVLLALAGGFLDAYTYLARGHVFANAQTGNIVLLGLRAADGNWGQALEYFIPVAAFVAGILVAEVIRRVYLRHPSFHWRQAVVFLQIILLFAAAFVPMGPLDSVVNTVISFVCAMQVQAFRKIRGNAAATTMCTGNLRSASEGLYHRLFHGDRAAGRQSLLYFGIIFSFILGAALGGAATALFSQWAVLLCCVPLVFVFLLMFQPRR